VLGTLLLAYGCAELVEGYGFLAVFVAAVTGYLALRTLLSGGRPLLVALLCVCALQSVRVALVIFYRVDMLRPLLPVTATLVPPLSWITFRDALANASALGVGPKIQAAIAQLDSVLAEASALMLPSSGELPPPTTVAEGLQLLLNKSGYLDALRASRDPQDEARVENLDELVAVTREFARNNPDGTIIDFLTEVALVADADDLDDASGSVSLMTMHTAKGLEYDTVFITGVEEDLIPHRISAGEPGGPQEERRLFYVGVTRARARLYLTLAMTRAQFGEVSVAMPSRFLQEIPATLIDWRQSPGDVNSRGGSQSRALNARPGRGGSGGGGFGGSGRYGDALVPKSTSIDKFANRIPAKVRDNGDMELAPGDRIRHDDFGEGRVDAVTGEGAKRVAHVRFDSAGAKKLLIKIAPIEKL